MRHTVISRTRITIECIDYAIQPNTKCRDFFPVRLHAKEPLFASSRRVYYFRRGLWRELERTWHHDTMGVFLKSLQPSETIDICFDSENGVIVKLNHFSLLNTE
jgi:hypothetical protein